MGIIAWIVLGLGAGLLANMLILGKRSQGLILTCLSASSGRRWKCDFDRAQEARYLAPQADGDSAPRLRRLLHTRGGNVASGRSDLLPGHVHGDGAGRRAPHHNRRLHHRVRASSRRQQA